MSKSKWIRRQLALISPFLHAASLSAERKAQEMIGKLLPHLLGKHTRRHRIELAGFEGAWVRPNELLRRGVILYLHGGGYTCGDLDYASGVGSVLASRLHCNVFCPAYRLAPEAPFPAALEDAVASYQYLLRCGYTEKEIVLSGESAGGGLIFALCLRLRELGLPMPAGLIAISPWADLSLAGASYQENVRRDPTMTNKQLQFYADSYTGSENQKNPLVSPVYADLNGFPPTLLFASDNELMRDDARTLQQKLSAQGVPVELVEGKNLWHAYLVYGLKEFRRDYAKAEAFLISVLQKQPPLRWMRLDNVAKLYPAALRRNWSNVFRVSATLKEPIQKEVLQTALDITVRRFPSMAVRLRRGLFWYYLEELPHPPNVRKEGPHPLFHMPMSEIRTCAFRVLCYENRIAAEFFHSVTDGAGAMVFLKTLCAEYLHQRYGLQIPPENGVLDIYQSPDEEELSDSFLQHAGAVKMGRGEASAYHLRGKPYIDNFVTATTGMVDVQQALQLAKRYHVTLTAFLCAVMMQALAEVQDEQIPKHRQKPVKVLLPVNLRPFFDSHSLRNFVLFITPEIHPKMGTYSFEEICKSVHHQMGLELTPKRMQARITTNVRAERSPVLKFVPLFLKNLVMKCVFKAVGESKFSITLSNLGKMELPHAMQDQVDRMDFFPGIQSTVTHNCGVLSYGDTLYINFVRSTTSPTLEAHFFALLQKLGLCVKVESNSRYNEDPYYKTKQNRKGG